MYPGPQLEKMLEQLRAEFAVKPPLPGAHTPRKGETVAALFSDGQWYRAKIERIDKNGKIHLFYVDYGNVRRSFITTLYLRVLVLLKLSIVSMTLLYWSSYNHIHYYAYAQPPYCCNNIFEIFVHFIL